MRSRPDGALRGERYRLGNDTLGNGEKGVHAGIALR
jgi:hypothetical protein